MAISCSISAQQNGETIDAWSGTLFQDANSKTVLTTFYPLAKFLSCSAVTKLTKQTSFLSNALIHDVSLIVSWKGCDINANKVHRVNVNEFLSWKSVNFEWCIKKLTNHVFDWDSNSKNNEKSCCDGHNPDVFASWFMMLQFNDESMLANTNKVNKNDDNLQQGMSIWTCSYPFGSPLLDVFSCCASKGIICNRDNTGFLLTDARCLPGSQGGGIYSKNLLFSGMIISPLCIKTGELSGMTIACTVTEIARSYQKTCSNYIRSNFLQSIFSKFSSKILPNAIVGNPVTSLDVATIPSQSQLVDEHLANANSFHVEVVSLKHHKGWGSGVVVALLVGEKTSKVYIATCKHVVGPSIGHNTLRVKLFTGSYCPVTITRTNLEYVSNMPALDFAVVSITVENSIALKLLNSKIAMKKVSPKLYVICYEKNPLQGHEVIAKGHCLVENSEYKPTITSGVLSTVVYSHKSNRPILLHSTCIVHDGASGGALLSPNQGKLYGILVNNVKEIHDDSKRQVLYPDVNFSVPACLFMPYVEGFLKGKSFRNLEKIMENGLSWGLLDEEKLKSKL